MQKDSNISPAEVDEFSRAFNLHASLDEAKATATRLRAAADRTTGLERESNARQAAEVEAEVSRIEADLASLEGAHHSEGDSQTKPARTPEAAVQSRQRQQEQDILQILRSLGHDPKCLPRPPAGKPGPKAEARAALPKMSLKVFDKAWDRLRGFGDIRDVG